MDIWCDRSAVGGRQSGQMIRDHHVWMKQQLNVHELLGSGLHGDGVLCKCDRSESVCLTSINPPGLTRRNGRLRIPIIILPDHSISYSTSDDIYQVLAWDMGSLLCGARPECRHDMSPWEEASDRKRSKLNGARDFRSC